jgi:hypothetical protein
VVRGATERVKKYVKAKPKSFAFDTIESKNALSARMRILVGVQQLLGIDCRIDLRR